MSVPNDSATAATTPNGNINTGTISSLQSAQPLTIALSAPITASGNATSTTAQPQSLTSSSAPIIPNDNATAATIPNGNINTGTISSLQSAQPLTSTPPTTVSYSSTLHPTSTTPTTTAQNPYPYAYQNQIQNPLAQLQSPSNPGTVQTQQQPIANAAAPQTVFENSIVTLYGRAGW